MGQFPSSTAYIANDYGFIVSFAYFVVLTMVIMFLENETYVDV
jgi:hypothetical protein